MERRELGRVRGGRVAADRDKNLTPRRKDAKTQRKQAPPPLSTAARELLEYPHGFRAFTDKDHARFMIHECSEMNLRGIYRRWTQMNADKKRCHLAAMTRPAVGSSLFASAVRWQGCCRTLSVSISVHLR